MKTINRVVRPIKKYLGRYALMRRLHRRLFPKPAVNANADGAHSASPLGGVGAYLNATTALMGEVAPASVSGLFPGRRLLIIGDLNLPQCKKYRVMQKVELLSAMGLDVVFAHWQDGFRCFNLMQLASIVLFYRVPGGSPYFEYVDEARRLGLQIGYDIDDPIYDRSIYSNNANLNYLSTDERAGLLAGTSQYSAAMSIVDFLVTSTTFMQEHMAQRFRDKTVHRLPNFVDAESWACLENIRRSESPQQDQGRVVVTYASGSRAHEADFRVAEHALHVVMKTHENVVLHVLGHLNLPASFDEFSDRIKTFPLTSHCSYLKLLHLADVVIVPLVANRFNECKSAIRYLEAGLLGKAAVLSRVGEFREAVTSHVNGVLCEPAQWQSELDRVIADAEYRRGIGKEAHRNVMMNYRKESILSRFDIGLKFWLVGEESA